MMKLKGPIAALAAVGAVGLSTLAAAPAALAAPSKPKAAAVVQEKTADQEKRFFWGELHVGDCQQNNGTIVVRSDGSGDWSATTLTYHTHSGDVWKSSFDFYTAAGFHLFYAGRYESPRMNDGNPPPRYDWGAHFVFDPAQFNSIDHIVQHSEC